MLFDFLVFTYPNMKFDNFLITLLIQCFKKFGGDKIKNVRKLILSRLDDKLKSVFKIGIIDQYVEI